MRKPKSGLIVLVAILACPLLVPAGSPVVVLVDGQELVHYQAEPLATPKGGEKFKGSNFIHPLKTPSGFVVTDSQPEDHLHHFGLWWPWKYVKTGNRKVLCWELQQGDGLIQARESRNTDNGFTAQSDYLDRKAPGGPVILLAETANITTSPIVEQPARGYFLDLEIIHRPTGDEPLTVVPYRYSGFALRGTPFWNRANSTIVTSDGKDRDTANFTHARWVRVQGDTDKGGKAGVLLMSRPDNRSHPEKLRTWDTQQDGAVFINFNTVADEPWIFEPGRTYARHFRLFVYDGEVTAGEAEKLWQAYRALVPEAGKS